MLSAKPAGENSLKNEKNVSSPFKGKAGASRNWYIPTLLRSIQKRPILMFFGENL